MLCFLKMKVLSTLLSQPNSRKLTRDICHCQILQVSELQARDFCSTYIRRAHVMGNSPIDMELSLLEIIMGRLIPKLFANGFIWTSADEPFGVLLKEYSVSGAPTWNRNVSGKPRALPTQLIIAFSISVSAGHESWNHHFLLCKSFCTR